MYLGHLHYRPSHRNLQRGYMLVVLIFLMVGLTVAMLATAPAIATAIKRDKEEEMVHRGVEYARAIKKYYKKFGRYPANLEALEDTNHMRFLRKRYKDPFTQDGKWDLVRFGQVNMNATQRQGGGGFTGGGGANLPNVPGVTNMLQGTPPTGTGITGGFGSGSTGTSSSGSSFGSSSSGSSFGQSTVGGTFGQSSSGTSGQPGTGSNSSSTGGNSPNSLGGTAGQAFGGGAIIGVSSKSERESLRIVAEKNHYKDWKFIYDPTMDRGGLITGPYDPKKQMGQFANPQQIGTPAGQLGTNPNSNVFGQPNNFGQGQGSFGGPQQPPDIKAPPSPQ